ncbi:MAG: DUF4221 family protein [Ferruginibacter sp.]|nr:DUF4221 family protein [Ferruginibacter sp.]
MKLTTFLLALNIFAQSCKNQEQKLPILKLPNEGVLKIIDSLQLDLDSLTIPNSENIYLIDTFVYICNVDANLITKININTNQITNTIFNCQRFGKRQEFSAIWIQKEKIFAVQNKFKKGFVFKSNGILIDSFLLAKTEDNNLRKIITDNPLVSTIQPLLIKDSIVHSLGFALMEGNYHMNDARFVLCASNIKEKIFYVNYPKSYDGKNWGGTYLRMVYGTTVGDSLMAISFPATSQLAVFNVLTNSTRYINCFPNIDSVVAPVGTMNDLDKKQIDIARHFFKQYSFHAIIFDKYRNVYYRILYKPIPTKNENSIGNLAKQILVYDTTFKYLGFTQIDGSLYSNSIYLVHPKGLLIQKLKDTKNEEHINFDLFALDSITSRKLQAKR